MRVENRLPSVAEYFSLRELVGWWPVDENAAEKALGNSVFSAVAVMEGSVIGMGRIAGDGGLYYYIQDLMVHPSFQGNGVGKALMEELMAFIYSHTKPGAFIGLMAAKGLEAYYQSFGFRSRDNEAPGMYLVIPKA